MRPVMITPVLALDESGISCYDPQNPADLSLLWTAFSKTSHVVEQGERLRNLSWRLWNRERLCCTRNAPPTAHSAPNAHRTRAPSLHSSAPRLSSSVDSASTIETDEDGAASIAATSTTSMSIRNAQNPPKERHFTPLDLRNMVHSIRQPREFPKQTPSKPLARPSQTIRPAPPQKISTLQSSPPRHVATESSSSTVATAMTDSFASTGAQSESSASSNSSSQHSIVRGFTPGTNGTTSYTSKIQVAPQPQPQPIVQKASHSLAGLPKKKGMFMLGCSSGSGASGEEEDSLRESLISRSLRSSTTSQQTGVEPKKQTSFKDEVAVMKPNAMEDAAVFEDSDDEDGSESDVDDSAIDDEDDDAWEDEGSEAQEPEAKKNDEMKFYRVDSTAHLPTRRSALTLNLEDQRNGGRQNSGFRATPAYKRSRTSTPNGPSMPGSPEPDSQLEMRAQQMGMSKPIIPTTTNSQPLPPLTSPRTTRRNMMNGELSASLRKNMLSERQQRNPLQIDSDQLRRAHTAFDVPRLSNLPENGELQKSADSKDVPNRRNITDYNRYFNHSVSEFNQAGW